MAIQFTQQVTRLGIRQPSLRAIAIDRPLPQRHHLPRSISRPQSNRAIQAIVGVQRQGTLTVPLFHRISHHIQHHPPHPSINAVNPKVAIRQIIDMLKSHPTQRIRHRQYIAANIVGRTSRVPILRRVRPVPFHSFDRATQPINLDTGRREMVSRRCRVDKRCSRWTIA